MLERINKKDYRFRFEGDDILLGYNVITAKMFFFKGNLKKYIECLLNNTEPDVTLENKYIDYLINNKIIIRGDDLNGI